jgi:hypothetical protein
VDYRRQKIINQDTYVMVSKGAHEFNKYSETEFYRIIDILNRTSFSIKNSDKDFWIYPPIDALIINNEIHEVYTFRKKLENNLG